MLNLPGALSGVADVAGGNQVCGVGGCSCSMEIAGSHRVSQGTRVMPVLLQPLQSPCSFPLACRASSDRWTSSAPSCPVPLDPGTPRRARVRLVCHRGHWGVYGKERGIFSGHSLASLGPWVAACPSSPTPKVSGQAVLLGMFRGHCPHTCTCMIGIVAFVATAPQATSPWGFWLSPWPPATPCSYSRTACLSARDAHSVHQEVLLVHAAGIGPGLAPNWLLASLGCWPWGAQGPLAPFTRERGHGAHSSRPRLNPQAGSPPAWDPA